MTTVQLEASGYSWRCPECDEGNYTGEAPQQVVCRICQAEFLVAGLEHRLAETVDQQLHMFNVELKDSLSLDPDGENPF
jgi:hypothetical protein